MKKILVTVADSYDEFGMLLEGATTIDVAASLVRTNISSNFVAGRVMADFCYAINSRRNVRGLFTKSLHHPFITHIQITHRNTVHPLIKVYEWGQKNIKMQKFSGYLREFALWVKQHQESEDLCGKTVVFRYLSGSAIGNRLVKVESVDYHKGQPYLFGLDLSKNEKRQYNTRHIDGDIIVIDEVIGRKKVVN